MAAKEMLILFVYDLDHCKTEHDDPLFAIKYFHPSWVSDPQKLALCSHLMGLTNFCCDFSFPDILSLQSGKFKIERFGRFIMAMGSDRNVSESLLRRKFFLMVSILRIFHLSVERIFEEQQKNFSNKLFHIFETYMPILNLTTNLLQNVYKLFLPKSATNLYLDAIQILEHIACRRGILGGAILYQNKVVASQFSTDLTKILTATDPVRIKPTAEFERDVNFHIPNGSQIIKIYIKVSEYQRLQKQIKKVNDSTSLGIQNSQALPFSIKKKTKEASSMKREKSLIFSNIPEEEALVEIPLPEKSRHLNRPNHLPLKFKTVQSRELPESGIASIISFDESDSFADFIGRTSVCCTPMTENKILIGPMPSIFIPSQMSDKVETKSSNKMKLLPLRELEQIHVNFMSNPFKDLFRRNSCNELNKISDLDEDKDSYTNFYRVYNTIADPIYPMFSTRKQPMSQSMFEEYRNLHITDTSFFKPPKIEKILENVLRPDTISLLKKIPAERKNSPSKTMRNEKKKMMRLPIKSISLDTDTTKPSATDSTLDSLSTKTNKYMGNLQLTPLMSKLTTLAMSGNEKLSSFDLSTPIYETSIDNTNRFDRLSNVEEVTHEVEDEIVEKDDMKRVDLFVCGQQNMTLMVIADENFMKSDQQIVQSMFDICVNRLSRLEQKLNEIINVTVDLKASDYSFINLDKKWDILKRGGAWQQNDFQALLLMHDHFANKNISDVIIKSTNDSLIYGHNSGEFEVYYQHASQKQSTGGLPAPSDFTIISQAKRRLERDHSLVLF